MYFLIVTTFNLGQKAADKFAQLSILRFNEDFSMKFFTADILRFCTEKRQNLAFGKPAVYSFVMKTNCAKM